MSDEEPPEDEPPEDEEQLSLIDPLDYVGAGARLSDPDTSQIAAWSQTPEKVAPIKAAVLLTLEARGPSTDAQLWAALGGPESSPRKRRGELERFGLVEPCGETISQYGMPTLLWRLSAFGAKWVGEHRGELAERAAKRKRPPGGTVH